jgi:hypothetical protein
LDVRLGEKTREVIFGETDGFGASSQNGLVEKIVSKSGMFSCAENVVSKHHVYHAIHHNFTTKTPQSAHPFSQKPLQKHLSTSIQKKSP